MAFEWRADQSQFDAMLRGGPALGPDAQAGMDLFYGVSGCSTCHSGPFQTDQGFHAMGEPQIGPGKAERFESNSRDLGRMRVTNRAEDAYAFRTPSLRNVTKTGPWGHAGAFSDIAKFLAHHSNPAVGMEGYDPTQPILIPTDLSKDDWAILNSPEDRAAIAAAALPGRVLGSDEISKIIAFLESLRDQSAIDGRLGIPESVPSGLPVER
jgi:cytochrome c peroxidase